MGYACPVCDDPQADGEHLANHLAFTAMLHGDDHADFLDAHVDGWEDRTPPELAAELIHHADRVEHETVFEDTTEGRGMGRPGDAASGAPGGSRSGAAGGAPGEGDAADTADGSPDAPADEGWSARPPEGDDGLDLDALDDATLDEETRRVVDEARKLFERGDEPDEEA